MTPKAQIFNCVDSSDKYSSLCLARSDLYLSCILYLPCVQVLVSALGAADDSGLLRFGLVLYTREGEYLHGLHEKDSGLGEIIFLSIFCVLKFALT